MGANGGRRRAFLQRLVPLGAWLIASPFIFAYAGALSLWHYALGAAVILLAVLELWQDRNASDADLARYGH